MPGPPRTPTQTRKARGNPSKRAYNKREPKLEVGVPPAPEDMDDDAKAEWHRLIASALKAQVLTVVDRSIVEVAAHAYSIAIRAERVLNEEGLTYETTNTTGGQVIKRRPEVEIASDGWRRYRAAICELGFTPAARSKVSTVDPEEKADPGERYFN